MAWTDVIGQERVKQILQNTFIHDRVASSYLFVGNEGIGKDALAIEFAKLMNCPDPIINENGQNSEAKISDEFDKKYKSSFLSHPNIISVFPIPAPKAGSKDEGDLLSGLSEDQVKEIQDELEKKSKDPYYKMNISGTLAIRVSQVRKIKQILKMSNVNRGKRVIILFDAHLMNEEASNAILKSIEEPSENTIFILITHSPEFILSTIRSRCQLIRFDPLKDEHIKEYLIKEGIDTSNLDFILPFAQGSITRAIEFADDEIQKLRDISLDILRNGLRAKVYREKTIELIEEITSLNDRKLTIKSILIIAYWLQDCLKKSSNNNLIINKDQEDIIEKFVQNFGGKNISKAIIECEESIRMINQNVNQTLVYLSLIIKLRRIFL